MAGGVAAVEDGVVAARGRGPPFLLLEERRGGRGRRAADLLELGGIEQQLAALVHDQDLGDVPVHGQEIEHRLPELLEVELVEAQEGGRDGHAGEAGEGHGVLFDPLSQLLLLGEDHVDAVEDEDGHDHRGKGQRRAGLEAVEPEDHVEDPLEEGPSARGHGAVLAAVKR